MNSLAKAYKTVRDVVIFGEDDCSTAEMLGVLELVKNELITTAQQDINNAVKTNRSVT